ncbi:MAG TPA: ImmA/IrrE family metallo-endopeptidase [Acidisarcina sp.]|nr:ImmA/IrrE family metallo-endopeptidase [Acidisarcina sp.]
MSTIYSSTDIDAGTTFLRGTTLLHPDLPEAAPDHVIAHELAHIMLHSRDEAVVEAQTRKWLERQKHAVGSLVPFNLPKPSGAN